MIKVKHLIKRDSLGRVTEEIFTEEDFYNFDNVEVKYKYDSEGNLSERSVVPFGLYGNGYSIRTKYKYDSQKRLVAEMIEKFRKNKTISLCENQYVYDSDGNLCKLFFGEVGEAGANVVVDYTYSADNKEVTKEVTFAGGNKQTYNNVYNADGKLIRRKCTFTSSYYADTETEFFYDSEGNVVKRICTDSDNKQTFTHLYYSDGKLMKTVVIYSFTEEKREINYEYDSQGRMIKQHYINPYNELITTQFVYDEFGNEILSFIFDRKSRLTEINIAGVKTEIFQYSTDNDQLLKHKILLNGKIYQLYTYDYDSNGNIIKETSHYKKGKKSSIEKSYDENNNLIKEIITNEDGTIIVRQYKYNTQNILTEESLTDADGKTVKWKYSYCPNEETRIEIDNTENAEYDIDECGSLFPKW